MCKNYFYISFVSGEVSGLKLLCGFRFFFWPNLTNQRSYTKFKKLSQKLFHTASNDALWQFWNTLSTHSIDFGT